MSVVLYLRHLRREVTELWWLRLAMQSMMSFQ